MCLLARNSFRRHPLHPAMALPLAALAASLSVPSAAHGQAAAFPAKPLRLIVPVAPGGGIDLVARAVAPRLSEELGQGVIVENRAGNAMVTGTAAVTASRLLPILDMWVVTCHTALPFAT